MVKDMANKHCGLDPMPTDVVKRCLSQLSPLLTTLVNQSLSSVPSDLQQALVFPTIKNTYGDRGFTITRHDLPNYKISSLYLIMNVGNSTKPKGPQMRATHTIRVASRHPTKQQSWRNSRSA
eukprot:sb/3475922/